MTQPLVLGLGATELIIILVLVMVIFGVSRIPDAMQGLGRGLRLFKDETRGLMDEDDKAGSKPATRPSDPQGRPMELGARPAPPAPPMPASTRRPTCRATRTSSAAPRRRARATPSADRPELTRHRARGA